MSDPTQPTEKVVYTVESSYRRCDVAEQALGYFRVYFGQDGEWLNSYRVTDDLKKAKSWANDWVDEVTDEPNLVEGIGNG